MAGEIKDKPQVEQANVEMDIGIDLPNSLVCLAFNKKIKILRLSPAEAVEVGKTLIDSAQMLIVKKV